MPKIPPLQTIPLSHTQIRMTHAIWFAVACQLTPFLSRLPLPSWAAWPLDLVTHWQVLWIALGAALALRLSLQRRSVSPWIPVVLGASATWFATQPATLRISQGPHETLTVVSANLWLENRDLSALHAWLNELNPDIVVLQEVSPAAAVQLKQWAEFDTKSIIPSEDPFGMAVLARVAGPEINWHTSPDAPPYVQLDFQSQKRRVSLYGIHPMPPIAAEYHDQRNALITQLSHIARKAPTLVVGDFNATPWSSAMPQDTLYRVLPILPTWHYLLPIDQVMATQQWSIVKSGRGPDIGSDHRPVWSILTLD